MEDYNNSMTIDQFYEHVSNNIGEDYLVKIAYRLRRKKEWFTGIEYCTVNDNGIVCWYRTFNNSFEVKVIAWCPADVAFNAWLERDDGYGT